MRAAVCRAYGPPEVVSVEDIPAPGLAADQVRVRVAAAAVNFPDVLVVADSYQMSAPLPFVPGSELAGVVPEVGDDGVGFTIGDRVMGTTFVGALDRKRVGSGTHVSVRVDLGGRRVSQKKKRHEP